MTAGTLRIYLGAAPGVGKTYAMLNEGWRRQQRGASVVVGIVETHARANTADQLRDLEVMPRRRVEYRGATLEEMDTDAVLARHPQVCLVDELAHTNAPGGRHDKRWQDVEELLHAGIDVISTLNIQHLESLNDVVERITGIGQRETIPDVIVRRADQIELVDMSPEALRRRMAHGNIYPSERIDAALANYFRPGNLGALRELALLWVADRVEESLHDYLEDHGITDTWETRERVVVAMTGAPSGDQLIRRAARMAARARGDLIGVHVASSDGLISRPEGSLDRQRKLLTELGGAYHEVVGADPAVALVGFARAEKGTQLVLGASRHRRWRELARGSVAARVTRLAGPLDVHVIASAAGPEEGTATALRRPQRVLTRRRTLVAWLLTIVGLPLVTVVLAAARDQLSLPTELLLFLSAVIGISVLGGRLVSAVSAVAASLLVNWYFVEPFHTFTVAHSENVLALVVFVVVALTVGSLVELTARRAVEAGRARAEAGALARTAATLAADPDPLPRLVEHLVETFGLDGASVLRRRDDRWQTVTAAGPMAPEDPNDGTRFSLDDGSRGDHHVLVVHGRPFSGDDDRVLRALTDQLSTALEARRLTLDAAEADTLADIDAVRTALLQAVSHDLRTPLATIKAMVSGLRARDVAWTPAEIADALAAIDEETDRLNRVVGNLLDASRMQSGALAVDTRPTAIDEPVAAALASIDAPSDRVQVDLADDLPLVVADPVLLERSIANLVANALRHSPPHAGVRVDAGVVDASLHLRIVDRGPGIPLAERERVRAPFQRLGDSNHDGNVGLGMAIASGFITAMHGELTLDDTPGGGLTATIVLPLAKSGWVPTS
ncbi:MAG: two-component system, OmpR family, sensor histidine kinase KdpD [Acidimicrobiaceae bacterium]|nr:two-component system, OmpR family, sensor histidine kinase KdpD [Acidimicrobiaceae bacterium]